MSLIRAWLISLVTLAVAVNSALAEPTQVYIEGLAGAAGQNWVALNDTANNNLAGIAITLPGAVWDNGRRRSAYGVDVGWWMHPSLAAELGWVGLTKVMATASNAKYVRISSTLSYAGFKYSTIPLITVPDWRVFFKLALAYSYNKAEVDTRTQVSHPMGDFYYYLVGAGMQYQLPWQFHCGVQIVYVPEKFGVDGNELSEVPSMRLVTATIGKQFTL